VAPWADPHDKPDVAEARWSPSCRGASSCGKGPHYKLTDYTADLLFQGAVGEMHDSDKSKDPQKLAAAVGFTGTPIKALETGCEFDWHFVDQSTVEVDLDDYVYVLKKQ
jgi:hypothetical protein